MLNGWRNIGMEFSRNKLGGKYHGLENQGATCYLNSVLQVLFMTEEFRESVKRNNAGKEHIDKELKDLFEDLEKHDGYTYKITNKLKIKNVYEQRDAAEHYEKILRLTSPEVSQIFHGELVNRTTCKQCESQTESPAGFWCLPLPLVNDNNEYSVERGIEEYFHSSVISGDDQMYCETCEEKCDAVLDCVVKHHPKVLVLLLKRFEFDYSYMTYVKINQPVNVANTVQLRGKSENQSYKLYAIVEHFGELRYGHYISTVRSQDDDKWYRFDDSKVSKVDPHIASTMEGSQSAYLLFYQKQDENRDKLKRRGSFDKKKQENKAKKPKPEQSVEEHGSDHSSSSSQQMCDPFPFGKKEQLSQMYPDHEKWDRPVKANGLQTNLTEAEKQECSLKSCSQQNVQVEGTLCETSDNCCEDHGGCEVQHSCSDVKTAMTTKNELMTATEETLLIQNDSNREKSEGPDHFVTETVNAKDGKDGGGENSVQCGFDNRKNNQATITEFEKRCQVDSQEGCSNKSDIEQHLVQLCENNGECEDQQSCPNVNPKTAMGQNDEMTEAYESRKQTRNLEKWDGPANSLTHTLVNAKDSKAGGDNGGCEGLQSCSDVHMTIEKQEQGSDWEETIFNEGTIDACIEDDCDSRLQVVSPDDSSLGWQAQCHVEKNNAKEELLDKSDDSTQDTESSELSMMHTLTSSVHVKLEEEDKANKSCLSGESSEENDYEKLEKGYYVFSHRIHGEGFDQNKSFSPENDVHMENYRPKENLISADVLSENMNITATYKHDPSHSTSVNQKCFRPSFSTMQKDEAEREKNDQNMNLQKLEITEKSNFSVERQAGGNINAHEELTERAKEKRPLLKIYDLYLDSINKKPEKCSVVQPAPVATTFQTEYPSSGANKEGFRQESVVHTSCNIYPSEKSEMGSNLMGQVTYAGRQFERVDVIGEGNVETVKITLMKRK